VPVFYVFQNEIRFRFILLQIIFDTSTISVDKCTFLIDIPKTEEK